MSTDVRCVECSGFSLQDSGKDLMVLGFGCCQHEDEWRYFGATRPRPCSNFAQAPADVVSKRERWLSGVVA